MVNDYIMGQASIGRYMYPTPCLMVIYRVFSP